ncbi:hypothetical protein [Ponticaulis sp.]|uniref:hypothetical protein n=1 Tax=Ponticaulis sp. TaxID=2020902 RepID=UPI000B681A63|nr:hypothetical protein [Ponticaulis sp.]MAI91543.1 hypothetical protein [Ponticaulis sp.]OUX97498.1 MAG: hypothetical protein CBB65_13960 [Hyphomonadaceae bacterium TMED5]|tara:strand:+ start:279 stop:608 length:330 start_codon:yes stop_codon:yes gene_type:complete
MEYHDRPDQAISHSSARKASKPIVEIDFARYEHYLADPDLTEKQRRELLTAIWNIIVEFVSLGYGVHPLRQACGQPRKANTILSAKLLDALECSQFQNATEKESSTGHN